MSNIWEPRALGIHYHGLPTWECCRDLPYFCEPRLAKRLAELYENIIVLDNPFFTPNLYGEFRAKVVICTSCIVWAYLLFAVSVFVTKKQHCRLLLSALNHD
jgi:hypothetical protein